MKSIHLAVALLGLSATTALAGPIEQACLRSDRDGVSRNLCGCIQNVADEVQNYGAQRRAAGIISNPQKAQDVRQSDRASDEAFWLRYKAFGDHAESNCAQG